jgi:hypothetical protein
VTVELLAACCKKASEEELERVRNACFLLGDAACWELKRPRWVALEFELLRQAALAVQRPGHLLLVQTLERTCSCEAYGLASFIGAERQVAELETEVHSTVAQGPEVSEPAETLLTASQVAEVSTPTEVLLTSPPVPMARELVEAPLTSVQTPEVGSSAPEPMPAGGPGALCTEWSGCHTT